MRSLVVYAASGCNLRCKHCAVGSDQARPRESLSIADIVAIVRNAGKSGVRNVTLIGGEVTYVHHDLSPIFAAGDDAGVSFSLNTNLHFIEKLIPLIEYKSFSNISFSLDGASAETNDKLRGRGSFDRVVRNLGTLQVLTQHKQEFSLDLNYTINQINAHEAMNIVKLANQLKIRTLNVALTEYKDFAERNRAKIGLDGQSLVDALTSLLISWIAVGKTQIDINTPPLFTAYLKERFGYAMFPSNFSGCGGPDVYGYVDNMGNHFPCPSMSFEHSRKDIQRRRLPRRDATQVPLKNIWDSSVFDGFERARSSGALVEQMFPCSRCVFRSECRPCTYKVIEGTPDRKQQLCSALYESAEKYLPGFRDRHFLADQVRCET
jgi:MoaA/NifB/PqqE/SkfB family radical SAM enzyme